MGRTARLRCVPGASVPPATAGSSARWTLTTAWPTAAATGPSAWTRSMATRAPAPRASGTVAGDLRAQPAWVQRRGGPNPGTGSPSPGSPWHPDSPNFRWPLRVPEHVLFPPVPATLCGWGARPPRPTPRGSWTRGLSGSGVIPSDRRCHCLGARLAGPGEPHGHTGRNLLSGLQSKARVVSRGRNTEVNTRAWGRSREPGTPEEKGAMGALAGHQETPVEGAAWAPAQRPHCSG